MRTSKYFDAVLIALVLSCAVVMVHNITDNYVLGQLPPRLFLTGYYSDMLPGLVSALGIGLMLALVARLTTPLFAFVVPVLATVPWIVIHAESWAVYGAKNLWWTVLSDVVALLIATCVFAKLLGLVRIRATPQSAQFD